MRLANVVRALPRRAHDLSRKTVLASQRWRILEAMTEAVAERGYADASVADVIAGAGVSRKTFYQHFDDKETCFLTAYDVASDRFVRALMAVGAEVPVPRDRVKVQLHAYLEVLSRSPALARVFLVEVLAAGPRAIVQRERVNRRFGELLLGAAETRPLLRKAIVGGINDVVAGALIDGHGDRLMALSRPLTDFVARALPKGKGKSG